LTPDLVEDVVARALELQAENRSALDGRRRGLDAELRKVDGGSRASRKRSPPVMRSRRSWRQCVCASGAGRI